VFFVNTYKYSHLFLDIISIQNQQTVTKNVFAELQKQYQKLTNCRNQSFISQIQTNTVKTEDLKIFKFTLTLLPHQLFILPLEFKSAMSQDFLSQFKVYNDAEIR